MKKGAACCLILLILFLLGLAIPLSGAETSFSAYPHDEMSQASAHHDTLWTLPATESRITLSQRLRMLGNEALRYTEKSFISFGKWVQINHFDIQAFATKNIVIYKQAMETYREIKPSLATHFLLTQRMCAEGLWIKTSSLS